MTAFSFVMPTSNCGDVNHDVSLDSERDAFVLWAWGEVGRSAYQQQLDVAGFVIVMLEVVAFDSGPVPDLLVRRRTTRAVSPATTGRAAGGQSRWR